MAKEYKTYEDLIDAPRQDSYEKVDFSHGKMFNLPDWVTWWTAKDTWGKPTKKDDAKEHTIDLRICGFVMDAPEYWPQGLRGRVGGLAYTFPFVHHRDVSGERHLCLKPFGRDGLLPGAKSCPRCESFFAMREATQGMEQKAAWEKIKVFGQRFSGLVFGYVDDDKENLRVFEFTDSKPGKSFEKDPTFFQRVVGLCTDKSIPAASRIDALFYSYGPRAQTLRLKFTWVAPQQGKEYWQLTNIFKVTEDDGAPSPDVDSSIAERIRPWEWMDIAGEQKRMDASDGSEIPKNKFEFDKMDYSELMKFAMENRMDGILAEGYEEDEIVALRDAIKKQNKQNNETGYVKGEVVKLRREVSALTYGNSYE